MKRTLCAALAIALFAAFLSPAAAAETAYTGTPTQVYQQFLDNEFIPQRGRADLEAIGRMTRGEEPFSEDGPYFGVAGCGMDDFDGDGMPELVVVTGEQSEDWFLHYWIWVFTQDGGVVTQLPDFWHEIYVHCEALTETLVCTFDSAGETYLLSYRRTMGTEEHQEYAFYAARGGDLILRDEMRITNALASGGEATVTAADRCWVERESVAIDGPIAQRFCDDVLSEDYLGDVILSVVLPENASEPERREAQAQLDALTDEALSLYGITRTYDGNGMASGPQFEEEPTVILREDMQTRQWYGSPQLGDQPAAPGADARQEVEIGYRGAYGGEGRRMWVEWDDTIVSGDLGVYRHELCKTLAALSAAAYDTYKNPTREQEGRQADNVCAALAALGFDHVVSFHYGGAEALHANLAAYAFGMKMVDGAPLVMVVIRGTTDLEEWIGNLWAWDALTDEQDTHEGFAAAASDIAVNLHSYLEGRGIALVHNDSLKICLTGHSRGGALANLAAAQVLDWEIVGTEQVVAYTFASPNVSRRKLPELQVFNIVNVQDAVPDLPPGEFGRYGQDLWLPPPWDDVWEFLARQKMHFFVFWTLTGKVFLGSVGQEHAIENYLSWLLSVPASAMTPPDAAPGVPGAR